MEVGQALILGLVQGLTEFLPISSSGHLVLVPALLGWDEPPIAFDVLLHAGSLIAVIAYFRHELLEVLRGLDKSGPARKLVGLLVVGTIPAALAGFLFEDFFAGFFSDPSAVAALLLVTAAILAASEVVVRLGQRSHVPEFGYGSQIQELAMVGWIRSLGIGAAQAMAILPGISRSGSTIAAGLSTGLRRTQAARFAFMLSIPILLGTSLIKIPELGDSNVSTVPLIIGATASLVSSYVAVAGLIRYLQRRGLYPFSAYCFVAGVVALWILR